MNLFTHSAHNLCAGGSFFSDHDFFAATYNELESDYDSLIERCIGLFGDEHLCLKDIISEALEIIMKCPDRVQNNKEYFAYLSKLEDELVASIETLSKIDDISQGLIQLLGSIAERSEIRQYKIKQRLKNA